MSLKSKTLSIVGIIFGLLLVMIYFFADFFIGRKSVWNLMGIIVLSGTIFCITLWIFLDRIILSRIDLLRKNIIRGAKSGRPAEIIVNGNDEVTFLQKETKSMLAAREEYAREIGRARSDLEDTVKELARALDGVKKDRVELANQRLAALNILEDVSDAQHKLEVANRTLQKRTSELESLKMLGDELIGVMDMDEAVNIIDGYLSKILSYSAATYLIFNPIKDAGLIFSAHLKEGVSENFLATAKDDFIKFLTAENDKESKTALKVLRSLKPHIFGAEMDNNNKAPVASKILFPLRLGDYTLGAIHIASAESGLARINNGGLISAMLATFSLSAARLHSLLRSQHSKTLSLVQSLKDGIVMFDRRREVILANPAVSSYTKLKDNGLTLYELDRIFAGINIGKLADETIKKNKSAHIPETAFGGRFYELSVVPVKDNRGRTVGGSVIIHDITHAREVDRMKTEFVSVASHQLRTPLTAIKLFTEMMIGQEVGKLNEEQDEYLHNIYQSTERMVRLVNDLLSLSRLESGRLRIEPTLMRMEDLVRGVITEIQPLAQAKGVKIDFRKNKRFLPPIPIDQDLMRQVVNNLITNAVRYSQGKNGQVDVDLTKKRDEYILSVKDNGIGIPAKVQPKIFNKFFRADNAVKTETEGTGLGLYVSKMIVESSGGKIWFKSEEGKGTEFFISLPVHGMKKKEGDVNLPGRTADISYS